MAVKAIVYKEHTLGYIKENSNLVGILRKSVLKGATFSVHDDPFFADPIDLRPATREDFEDYRVKWNSDYITVSSRKLGSLSDLI